MAITEEEPVCLVKDSEQRFIIQVETREVLVHFGQYPVVAQQLPHCIYVWHLKTHDLRLAVDDKNFLDLALFRLDQESSCRKDDE